MSSDGASAIARSLPTSPSFNLLNFLGEGYRDGMPAVPGIDLLRSRSAQLREKTGNEYLNIEFGWKPLVSDLQDFARTVKNAHEIIEQYRRDADRVIRRRYTYPETLSTNAGSGTGQIAPVSAVLSGTIYAYSQVRLQRWFSGAFRYHIPIGNDPWSKLLRYRQYANRLLGTDLTPEVVWNLTPWSWAIDWFTNAGDVMKNISAMGSDGLVLRYGYMMRHTENTNVYSATVIPSKGYISNPHIVSRHVREYKQRTAANPFGFGITDSMLTPRQLAILGALGLAKSGNMRNSTSADYA